MSDTKKTFLVMFRKNLSARKVLPGISGFDDELSMPSQKKHGGGNMAVLGFLLVLLCLGPPRSVRSGGRQFLLELMRQQRYGSHSALLSFY